MWDIVSRAWNKFRQNISLSKVYLGGTIYYNSILLIILLLFFELTFQNFIILMFILIFFSIIILNYFGSVRNREINNIKNIINSIRENRYHSPDEIKLGKNLLEMEGEIKAMFLRTQNDISNLKKLEQVRTEFLGNVSHELRTPIFAIQGYIETLLNGAMDDERVNRNFLNKANTHANNLNILLNDLIDISMIESGQMRMSYRFFNIGEYLESIINEMSLSAEEKGLELILYPPRQNLQLYGDKPRLKQVMVNLISNAIKYTEEGRIEVLVEEEKKYGRIIVRDTGLGIREKDIDRIFERFYRVDKDRSRAVGGTGLGLAIVKHIVEAHGSRMYVKSEWGKGSEFSFRLKK